MKQTRTKILYVLFFSGIGLSIFRMMTEPNQETFNSTLYICCTFIFILSLVSLLVEFEERKSETGLWVLLIICFPFMIRYLIIGID